MVGFTRPPVKISSLSGNPKLPFPKIERNQKPPFPKTEGSQKRFLCTLPLQTFHPKSTKQKVQRTLLVDKTGTKTSAHNKYRSLFVVLWEGLWLFVFSCGRGRGCSCSRKHIVSPRGSRETVAEQKLFLGGFVKLSQAIISPRGFRETVIDQKTFPRRFCETVSGHCIPSGVS